MAFLDLHPSSRGHTLIIPKTHASTLAALDTREIGPLFAAVKSVMGLLHRSLTPEGLTIGWNHGWAAGQQVHHLHVHIIPRYTGDGGRGIQSLCAGAPAEDLANLAAQISDTSSRHIES